jgi:hypothetical protein
MKTLKAKSILYGTPKPKEKDDPIKKIIDMMVKEYDSWTAPPVSYFLSPDDLATIEKYALSPYYTTHPKEKAKDLDELMSKRGFRFIRGGTNRRFYEHVLIPRVGMKLATCNVGMKNNIDDIKNQDILKPFCTKIFDVARYANGYYSGVAEVVEAGVPVTCMDELKPYWEQLFFMFEFKIRKDDIGIEDLGLRSLTQYCIRPNFGVIICDFPTMVVIDRSKCFCTKTIDRGGIKTLCGGTIDYDGTYSYMECCKCHQKYSIQSLKAKNGDSYEALMEAVGFSMPNRKEVNQMVVYFKNSDGVMQCGSNGKKSSFVDSSVLNTRTSNSFIKPGNENKGLVVFTPSCDGSGMLRNGKLVETPKAEQPKVESTPLPEVKPEKPRKSVNITNALASFNEGWGDEYETDLVPIPEEENTESTSETVNSESEVKIGEAVKLTSVKVNYTSTQAAPGSLPIEIEDAKLTSIDLVREDDNKTIEAEEVESEEEDEVSSESELEEETCEEEESEETSEETKVDNSVFNEALYKSESDGIDSSFCDPEDENVTVDSNESEEVESEEEEEVSSESEPEETAQEEAAESEEAAEETEEDESHEINDDILSELEYGSTVVSEIKATNLLNDNNVRFDLIANFEEKPISNDEAFEYVKRKVVGNDFLSKRTCATNPNVHTVTSITDDHIDFKVADMESVVRYSLRNHLTLTKDVYGFKTPVPVEVGTVFEQTGDGVNVFLVDELKDITYEEFINSDDLTYYLRDVLKNITLITKYFTVLRRQKHRDVIIDFFNDLRKDIKYHTGTYYEDENFELIDMICTILEYTGRDVYTIEENIKEKAANYRLDPDDTNSSNDYLGNY